MALIIQIIASCCRGFNTTESIVHIGTITVGYVSTIKNLTETKTRVCPNVIMLLVLLAVVLVATICYLY